MDEKTTSSSEAILQNKTLHPKIKRAFLFMEDEEWEKADEYFEAALDEDPTNAYAYLGKLMVQYKIKTLEGLDEVSDAIEENKWYKKALRFSDEKLSDFLNELKTSEEKETDLAGGTMPGEEKEAPTDTGKMAKKILLYVVPIVLALVLIVALGSSPKKQAAAQYEKAQELFEQREFEEAQAIFESLGDYKDSKEQISNCRVKICEKLISNIGYLSTYDPSYGAIVSAEKALAYYLALEDSEQKQVSNKNELPTNEEIKEFREIRKRKDAEETIKKTVLEEAAKEIKKWLKNPSSYQERTDQKSYAFVLWDEEDPTKVHGNVYIYYSALNSFGGRMDSSVNGIWNGTYINGVFTLEYTSIGTSMMLEALR